MPDQKQDEYKGVRTSDAAFLGGIVGGLVGHIETGAHSVTKRLFKFGEISGKKSMGITLLLAGVGAWASASIARSGKKQFDEDQNRISSLQQENAALGVQTAQLSQAITAKDEALAQSEKRFTDTVTSRQQHGGHAQAAELEKANAAENSIAR